MIKNQRQQQILDLIKENGSCTVQNLSQMFSVSEPTIRTDLRNLEKDGSIIRQHGGAFLKQETLHTVNLTLEDRGHNEEKRRIAKRAAKYVKENDNIILDSGTTVTALADELINVSPLQILTNSINIGFQLSKAPNTVVMLGGEIKKPTLSLSGSIGISMLQGVMVDYLFLATGGLDLNVGLSLPSFNDVELKKAMIASAKKVILLADSSKIGKVRFAAMGCLDKIDVVITDDKVDPVIKKGLEDLNIEVVVC